MADEKIYTIPLRRFWLNVPRYKRARKAVIAIKEYVAKHMKVPGRDTELVKVDLYLNNEIWFRGSKNPPAKIKVKVTKNNNLYNVTFAEMPEFVKFVKAKAERKNKEKESSPVQPASATTEAGKPGEKTDEEKKEEKEKEQAVAQFKEKEAKQQVSAEKHTTKPIKSEHPQRKVMQR